MPSSSSSTTTTTHSRSLNSFPLLLLLLNVLIFFLSSSDICRCQAKLVPNGGDRGKVPPEELPLTPENMEYLIIGEGTAAIGTQMQQWGYAYSTSNAFNFAARNRYFQSGTNFFVDIYYLNIRLVAYMANERYLDKPLRQVNRDLEQFPIAAQPVVFPYRLLGPGFTPYITNRYNESLVLTIDIIAKMYLGLITHWNDTEIQDLNPNLAPLIPPALVIPMGYAGRESSTFSLTQTFMELSPTWRDVYNASLTDWPVVVNVTTGAYKVDNPLLNPNMQFFTNAYGPFASGQDVNGSIAYVGFPIYRWAGGGNTPYALIHHKGEIREPTPEATLKAYKKARINDHNVVVDIDYEADGWPVSLVNYVIANELSEISEQNCDKDRELFKFWRWTLLNQDAYISSRANGFHRLPSHITEEVIARLEKVTCRSESKPLLDLEIIDDHDEGYFPALLALNFVLAGICIFIVLYLTITNEREGKIAHVVVTCYNVLLALGALMCYVGVVFFFLVPDATWVCQLRQWFLGLGFSIFLGAMSVRTLQMHRIWRMSRPDRIKPVSNQRMKMSAYKEFSFVIGLSLFVQITILVVWSSVDTLESRLVVLDDIARTASWVCKSGDVWLWVGIEIGFFAVMLAGGISVVYQTWDIQSKSAEGKWLLASIYNMVVLIAAYVPLFIILVIKDDNLYIFVVVGVDFIVSSTLFVVCMSKAFTRIEKFIFQFRKGTSKNSFDASTRGGSLRSAADQSKTNNTNTAPSGEHHSSSSGGV